MGAPNPLRESLTTGQFCYVVELVASRLTREALLLEVASQLAQVRGVVAGSITSYAGGAIGHDPVRVGTAARARGLTPNIHLTCVGRDRVAAWKTLEDLHALGIENTLALTGDYPKTAGPQPPEALFDLDSIQLVRLIDEARQRGMAFWISVAVSPFKYTEADCAYQYLKLGKKIAAGADCAITQLGYDMRKFRELKNYMDEHSLRVPVLGNVYVLSGKAAERMSKGEPPGCWVSSKLLEEIRAEVKAGDAGKVARLERAARMVAILRGLGYAGAYLGGDHRAESIRWIIRRSETLAPRWQELEEEFNYAPKNGFYFSKSPVAPSKKRGLIPRILDSLARLFPVNRKGPFRNFLVHLFRFIEKKPALSRAVERFEYSLKSPLFGCQACGNCVLSYMEYVCPQTCPKNLRNGPCGGATYGQCEVVDKPCIWVAVYDRAKAAGRLGDLEVYVPPPRRELKRTSSWVNYFLGRDSRPGNFLPLAEFLQNEEKSSTAEKLQSAENLPSPPVSSAIRRPASEESIGKSDVPHR